MAHTENVDVGATVAPVPLPSVHRTRLSADHTELVDTAPPLVVVNTAASVAASVAPIPVRRQLITRVPVDVVTRANLATLSQVVPPSGEVSKYT